VQLEEELLTHTLGQRSALGERVLRPAIIEFLARIPGQACREPAGLAHSSEQPLLARDPWLSGPELAMRRLVAIPAPSADPGWTRSVEHRHHADVLALGEEALRDLERDDRAKAIAGQEPRSAGVHLSHLREVMGGHILHGLQGRAAAVETTRLQSVERLIGTQAPRQRLQVKDCPSAAMHAEDRWPGALGLDWHKRCPP
jgi:hypothetical protein